MAAKSKVNGSASLSATLDLSEKTQEKQIEIDSECPANLKFGSTSVTQLKRRTVCGLLTSCKLCESLLYRAVRYRRTAAIRTTVILKMCNVLTNLCAAILDLGLLM